MRASSPWPSEGQGGPGGRSAHRGRGHGRGKALLGNRDSVPSSVRLSSCGQCRGLWGPLPAQPPSQAPCGAWLLELSHGHLGHLPLPPRTSGDSCCCSLTTSGGIWLGVGFTELSLQQLGLSLSQLACPPPGDFPATLARLHLHLSWPRCSDPYSLGSHLQVAELGHRWARALAGGDLWRWSRMPPWLGITPMGL